MATTVSTSPYRPSGPYQHEIPRPITGDERALEVRRLESLAIFLVFAVVFLVIGYRATIDNHVIVFDALDRLARSYMVWHNDPPKLAAIGFLFPPLSTMAYLPLAAIKPVATSLIAMPVLTAVFGAGTLVVLNLMFARAAMPLMLRIPLLVVIGISPLWLFYSGNGMSEMVYLFLLAGGLYGFVSWHTTRDARYLVIAGGALALAMLTRYAFIVWALMMGILIGVGLVAVRRSRNEVEGSMVAFLAPVVYGLALWTLFNLLIVGRPFGWLTESASGFAVNAVPGPRRDSGFGDVASQLLELLVGVSPLALAVLPVLIVVFVLQRNDMALWLAGFLALGVILIGVRALTAEDEGLLTLRSAMPIVVAAVVGAAWLYRSLEGGALVVWGVTLVLLIVGLFTNWEAMQTYRYQTASQAFTRQLFSGQDQEGRSSLGGFTIGINSERAMASYIKQRLRVRDTDETDPIFTDNAQTFAVILLTGRPQIFLDRIDVGDSRWRAILSNPTGRLARREGVQYMLVASQSGADLIRRQYRRQIEEGGEQFTRVFETDRYVLLRVNRRSAQARGVGRQEGTPVRPAPPLAPPTTQPGAAGDRPATPGSPSQTGAPGGSP